jgi:hypothetical protein
VGFLLVLFLVVTVPGMVIAMRFVTVAVTMTGAVVFVKLLGAIGTFEFVALAGNGKHGNGH